jgi:arsenate reductase (glutaredoxin)
VEQLVAWPQKGGQGGRDRESTHKGGASMAGITIYHKPTCSTCRQVIKLVEESGHPFTAINYYEKPFSKSALKGLLKKAGLKSSDIIRTKEEIYKKLNLQQSQFTDDELLNIMIKHPDLIQRPLVQKGEKVILARPPETVNKIF